MFWTKVHSATIYDILNLNFVNLIRLNKTITTPSKKKKYTILLMINLILSECTKRVLHQQSTTYILYNFSFLKQAS